MLYIKYKIVGPCGYFTRVNRCKRFTHLLKSAVKRHPSNASPIRFVQQRMRCQYTSQLSYPSVDARVSILFRLVNVFLTDGRRPAGHSYRQLKPFKSTCYKCNRFYPMYEVVIAGISKLQFKYKIVV